MNLYDWLIQNIFSSVDIVQYGDYVVLTLSVLTILFCCLIAKALCGVFNIFVK